MWVPLVVESFPLLPQTSRFSIEPSTGGVVNRQTLLLLVFFIHSLSAQDYLYEETRAWRVKELEATAVQLEQLVRNEDGDEFLSLVPLGLVTGPDFRESYEDLRQQFSERTGLVYCGLFDTSCLRRLSKSNLKDNQLSLKEILEKDSTVECHVSLKDEYEWDSNQGYVSTGKKRLNHGSIVFKWHGHHEDYGWHLFPIFAVFYDESRWIIVEHSEVP
jgi:hypothetical protein